MKAKQADYYHPVKNCIVRLQRKIEQLSAFIQNNKNGMNIQNLLLLNVDSLKMIDVEDVITVWTKITEAEVVCRAYLHPFLL